MPTRIDIHQKMISFSPQYDIHINDSKKYSALISDGEIILIQDINSIEKLRMSRIWSWFRTTYDIRLPSNEIINFKTKSFWKSHYQCQHGKDIFDIYSHVGTKCSVFKNDKQIAWWDIDTVTLLEGDNYTIVTNSSSDQELLIAFCLMLDKNMGGSFEVLTVNVGNILDEAKAFDPNWKP